MALPELLQVARREGRTVLTEVESKQLLREAGIPVVDTRLAHSRQEAMAAARDLGFPVVLKVLSPEIVHKSDVGGVRLGLATEEAVGTAYDGVMEAARRAYPSAPIQGVSVQPMARPGVEVIIGATRDPQFGPVLMFGLGGILVEVLKDVAFRIVPITRRDAAQMVREIKGLPLLQGARGREPADLGRLEEALVQLSALLEAAPQVKELDLNPIFAYSDGLVAVDARVVLDLDEG